MFAPPLQWVCEASQYGVTRVIAVVLHSTLRCLFESEREVLTARGERDSPTARGERPVTVYYLALSVVCRLPVSLSALTQVENQYTFFPLLSRIRHTDCI